jgi:hypothetical protein
MHPGFPQNLPPADAFSQYSLPDLNPFLHLCVHFLSFPLKMTIPFAAYAAAKKVAFSQKLPGSAAVLFRP